MAGTIFPNAEHRYGHITDVPHPLRAVRMQPGGLTFLMQPPNEEELDRANTAVAYLEYGRWIVKCPWCPSAQFASLEDPRFFCADCHNSGNGNRYVPVVWPKEETRIRIERALLARPADNQHWAPHEKVAQLHAENIEHGLEKEVVL